MAQYNNNCQNFLPHYSKQPLIHLPGQSIILKRDKNYRVPLRQGQYKGRIERNLNLPLSPLPSCSSDTHVDINDLSSHHPLWESNDFQCIDRYTIGEIFSQTYKEHKITVRIIIILLLIAFTTTVIALCVKSVLKNSTTSSVSISSADDFQNLQINLEAHPNVDTIIIQKLIDQTSKSNEKLISFKLKNVDKIKNLRISGPITEMWLQEILTTFNMAENLSIDIYELCVSAEVSNRNSLAKIILKGLKQLKLENVHSCSISSWIFNWQLPKIEQLEVINADLSRSNFEPMHNFIKQSENTLNSVFISNSFLCHNCVISTQQFPFIKRVHILNELESPIIVPNFNH